MNEESACGLFYPIHLNLQAPIVFQGLQCCTAKGMLPPQPSCRAAHVKETYPARQ